MVHKKICLTHWHLELSGKNGFLDILDIFSLDTSQISSNLFKTAFSMWQKAFLSTSIIFVLWYFCSCMPRKQNFKTYFFRLFLFFFFGIFFFSFSHLFAAVVALLLGLLSVQKFFRKRHRNRSSQVLATD